MAYQTDRLSKHQLQIDAAHILMMLRESKNAVKYCIGWMDGWHLMAVDAVVELHNHHNTIDSAADRRLPEAVLAEATSPRPALVAPGG